MSSDTEILPYFLITQGLRLVSDEFVVLFAYLAVRSMSCVFGERERPATDGTSYNFDHRSIHQMFDGSGSSVQSVAHPTEKKLFF